MSTTYKGLGVSPGVAVGRVMLLDAEALPVVPVPVPPERVDAEVAIFDAARDTARADLKQLRDRIESALGHHYAGVLDAQMLILDDPGLVAETLRRIRVGRVSAQWALKEVVGEYTRRFEALEEGYLRQRGGDLSDVHRRLQRLLGRTSETESPMPAGERIVVAHALGPADAVALADKGVVGLAADGGGRTSHTAILAQALSVPAVAGLHDVSRRIRPGETAILDGTTGELHLAPDAGEVARAQEARRSWIAMEHHDVATERLPAQTRDGVKVTIRANIEFPHEAALANRFGADGVGLYRSEFLFLSRSPELPSEEDHLRTYLKIAREIAPHPAVIRTLDLGGEKYFHEVLHAEENNPVLGMRGVRLCLKRLDIFIPQLRGLLRASAEVDLRIMLPLVTSVDEIRAVRELIGAESEKLRAEGHAIGENVPLGIMIEVPGAALAAELLATEADFFSIGTNDLIQYALAVDRGNESVNYLYEPLHPGVLRLLDFVLESGARAGIPVSLCGEMAADPEIVGVLIGLGLRDLSVQPRKIPAVRKAVREVDALEASEQAEQLVQGSGMRDSGSRPRAAKPLPGGDDARGMSAEINGGSSATRSEEV